ncbi:MAG: tetratricopeptide repeat protein [Leeuwenhoekiella sp.]
MCRRFIEFFLYTVVFYTSAQEIKIDSLKQLLHAHSFRDSTYVDLLNEIAWYQCFNNANEGLKMAEQAILLSTELQDEQRLVKSYSRKAVNLNTLGKDSLALALYDKIINIHKYRGDSVSVARTAFNKGIVYFNRSDYLHSTANYQRALSIFQSERDSLIIAKIYNSIGINQMTLTNYPQALSNYLHAARIYERAGKTESLDYANIMSNMGLLQARLGDLREAFTYQSQALTFFKKLGQKENIANALTNLGNISQDENHPDDALAYYTEALVLMREVGSKIGIANALCNIGVTYILKGEYYRSIKYLDSIRPIYKEVSNSNNLAQLHHNLGKAYAQLYRKENDKSFLIIAESHFRESTGLATTSGVLNIAQEAWEHLGNTLSLSKKYEEAFKANKMAMLLKDSLNMLSQKEETARLEAAYSYAHKEDALRASQQERQAMAQQEIDRQKSHKNFLIFGALMASLALITILYLNKRKRQARQHMELAEHRLKISETQLKALQAQLNPHFMFNSMNAVSAFILNKNPGEALDYLAKIAGLIRKTLQNSEEQFIDLEEEVQFMHDYISLEMMRSVSTITYAINIDKNLDPTNTLIPPAILQPFIENSIWHGPGSDNKPVYIEVSITNIDSHLFCVVEDNGVGRKSNNGGQLAKHISMGFKIAQSRIEIINRLYNIDASLVVIDKEEGLRIEMKLPYLTNY